MDWATVADDGDRDKFRLAVDFLGDANQFSYAGLSRRDI